MDKNTLYRFFSGNSSFEEEVEIRNWMESSSENKNNFFKERKLFDAMLVSQTKLNENKDKIYEKKAPSFIQKMFLEFLKIASVIAITVLITNYLQNSKDDQEAISMNTITVPAGQRVNMTLSDGTNVWLNARTTMHYPTTFSSKKREVTIDGEAYFSVAKDDKKPFIVSAGNYEINVLGTQFNVLSYSAINRFETSLMEGSLKLQSVINDHDSILLSPGDNAFIKNGELSVTKISDYDIFRWTEGLICFKNHTFKEIMYEFEKCYGMKVIINNQKVIKYIYTGKFRQSDGIDYALRVLQKSIYFKYTRDDDKHIIYIN